MAAACRFPLLHHLPSPHPPFPRPRFLLPSSQPRNPNPNPRSLALRAKLPEAAAKAGGGGGGVKKEQKMNQEGVIVEALPNCMFRVRLDATDDVILGYMSGKMQKNKIYVVPGDRVQVEIGRYDSSRGRITFRYDRRSNRPPPKSK